MDRPVPGWRRNLTPVLAAACAAACADGGRAAGAEGAASGDTLLVWETTVQLVEGPDVLSVLPIVREDPRGGFLVADQREAQIRRYDAGGSLAWHLGRKGSGPGEFHAPAAVVRLPRGEVVAADRNGRLTFIEPLGGGVLRTVETPLRRVQEMLVLDDTTLLLSGVLAGDPHEPHLHLWSLASDRLTESFFRPLADAENQVLSYAAGWTGVALRGDTIAATFSTSDTLYLFRGGGRDPEKRPLPFVSFRSGPARPPQRSGSPAEQARYVAAFDLVEGVFFLPDGSFVVSYQNVVPEEALARRQHLLHVGAAGERLAEARGVPRLLTVDGTGRLLFVHPEAEAPDRWAYARLR